MQWVYSNPLPFPSNQQFLKNIRKQSYFCVSQYCPLLNRHVIVGTCDNPIIHFLYKLSLFISQISSSKHTLKYITRRCWETQMPHIESLLITNCHFIWRKHAYLASTFNQQSRLILFLIPSRNIPRMLFINVRVTVSVLTSM